jgi:putative addiction module component (TIGR02574 family)
MSRQFMNIEDMSTEERLRLLEELWDSLSQRPENIPLTPEQREELDRRLDDLERQGPVGIPWEKVLRQIRSRPRAARG